MGKKRKGNNKEIIRGYCVEYRVDEELTQYILRFADVNEEFFQQRSYIIQFLAGLFIKFFEKQTLLGLSWDTMCKQLTPEAIFKKAARGKLILPFYKYLLDEGVNLGEHTAYLKENPWLLEYNGQRAINKLLYYNSPNPENLLKVTGLDGTVYMNLNTNSRPRRELLRGFAEYRLDIQSARTGLRYFIHAFENSLEGIEPQPQRAQDFNYRVFDQQFKFFCEGKPRSKEVWGSPVSMLKEFYLYLVDHLKATQEDTVIFPQTCGLDEWFLRRADFVGLYSNGFRVVRYNPFDETPIFDEWLLAPNGQAGKTLAERETEYVKFDFRGIKDVAIRALVKSYFWKDQGTKSLRAKQSRSHQLAEYFEWAEQETIKRTMGKVVDINKEQYDSLLSGKLFEDYYFQLRLTNSKGVLNNKWGSLKSFVEFLKPNYAINDSSFRYVRTKKVPSDGGKALSPEDVNLLIAKVKERLDQGDYEIEIFWIILQLLLSTNFRIQEILNLKRFCLDKAEVIKDGSFPVHMQRKPSKGIYINVPTDVYTHRFIKTAIAKTEIPANEAKGDIGSYIFIKKKNRNDSYMHISSQWFYLQFKDLLESIGLENKGYTTYNIRDTYMTDLLAEARKQGKSLLEYHVQTGHACITTTFRYYDDPDIKEYIEAFAGIIIGDVDIKGKIVEDIGDSIPYEYSNINEITVKDGCGYCSKEQCISNENTAIIDCLMCLYIVVPIDRLPFFLEALKLLDNQIFTEDNYHEKEHLISKKKLYLFYVVKIQEFKDNQKGKVEIVKSHKFFKAFK